MATSTLRASVTATTLTAPGAAATVLIDGSDTPVTANGLPEYSPTPGDRVLVQLVDSTLEVIQFVSRGVVPYSDGFVQNTIPTAAQIGDTWVDTALTPKATYTCIVAYSSGGTKAVNWLAADLVAQTIDVPKTTTVNGQPLSGNIVLNESNILPPAAPTSSPATTVVPAGIGGIKATWPTVANAEWYDVYVKNASGVTTGDELWGSIRGTTATIMKYAGASLSTTAPTYVAVVARNAIGSAAIGAQGSATAAQAKAPDIANFAVDLSKMTLISPDNTLQDPTFKSASPLTTFWTPSGPGATMTGVARDTSACPRFAADGSLQASTWTPVEGGTSLRLSAFFKGAADVPVGQFVLSARWKNLAGTITESTFIVNAEISPAGMYSIVSGTVTLPPEAVSYAFNVWNHSTTTIDVDWVCCTRASRGELLVDGTISGIKMQAGTFEGDLFKANTITADLMDGAAINGMTITGMTLQTAASGPRAGMSNADGIYAYGPDPVTGGITQIFGVPLVPDDSGRIAAFLRANVTATSLTVEDYLALRGVNNEFSKGSITTLASGTTAPQSPPQPGIGWPIYYRAFGFALTYGTTGIFAMPGGVDYYVCSSFFGGYIDRFTWNGASYDPTNIGTSGSPTIAMGDKFTPAGIAVIGNIIYVLTRDENRAVGGFGKFYVRKYNATTGAYISEWQYQPSGTTTGVYSNFEPSMTTDGTNLLIAQCPNTSSGTTEVAVRTYDTSGNLVSSAGVNLFLGDHISSINIGTFDLGVTKVYITGRNHGSAYAVSTTSTGRDATMDFPLPESTGVRGMCWDGTIFRSILNTSGVYHHSQHMWTASTSDRWWVAHSWYDSNATGGLHETSISKKVSFQMKKRAHLTITTPPLPAATGGTDDVTGVRIYHGLGTATPADANMKRGITDLANGVTTVTYSAPMDRTGSAANTGTPGPFPASTPAVVKSADQGTGKGWQLDGAGGGHMTGVVLQTRTRRSQTAVTNLATATQVTIASFGGTIETDGNWSYAGTGVLTCVNPGVYTILGQIGFDASTVGSRRTYISKNGSTAPIALGTSAGTSPVTFVQAIAVAERFAVGETVEIRGYQNTGGTIGTSGDTNTYISITRTGN
jgi:hypothetical protein